MIQAIRTIVLVIARLNSKNVLNFLHIQYINFLENKREPLLNKLYDRRQLKSQGIMERLKNKMEHDLNKYGWD